MPHILVNKQELIKLPFRKDDYLFEFYATYDKKKLILLGVKYKNNSFLLEIKDKENNFLIKYEKYTRPSSVEIIKNALKYFAELNKFTYLKENINTKNKNPFLDENILKEPTFFETFTKSDRSISIEIGFGTGRHLLHLAKTNSTKLYIGIEIHKTSIEQVIRHIKSNNILNILIVDFDARLFLELLKSNSISEIFIHFPVPWDKNIMRRVVDKEFLMETTRVLKKKGLLEIRTDSENYYNYCIAMFNKVGIKNVSISKNKEIQIISKYEERWKKMNKNIFTLRFINNTLSKEKKINFDFNFVDNFTVIDFLKLENKKIVEGTIFINFYYIFNINDSNKIIKVSFGDFNRSETMFLRYSSKKISYYPKLPIKTSTNILIHKKIIKILTS